MAARWAEAGRRPPRAAARRHRASRRDDRRPQRRTRPRAASSSRTRRPTRRSPTAGSRSTRPSSSPTTLADLAARRDRPRDRARPRGPALVRLRAARDLPGPEARRARRALGVDRRRPVRPVHPPAGERRPRRRPLARARVTMRAAASGSTSTSRARSRSRTSAPRTSPPRPTTSTSSPVAETIVHLDAAHRGLGTASCGPDTLPEYRLGPGTYRWAWTLRDLGHGLTDADRLVARRAASSTSTTTASATSCGSTRTARSATFISGRRWTRTGRYAHLEPTGFAGFSNRVGDPVAARIPDDGRRRLPDPGPDRRARRRLDASSTSSTSSTGSWPASRPAADDGLPATYVEADDEADTLEVDLADARERPRASSSRYTIFRDRPVVARSARIHERRHDADPPDRRHERRPRPARRALGVRPAERRVGAREPRRDAAACARAASRSAATAARRATSTTRSSPCAGRRRPRTTGEAYGFSLVYSGNFLAEAEVDPFDTTRVRHRDQPEHVHLDPRAGRGVRDARRRSSSTRTPGSAR